MPETPDRTARSTLLNGAEMPQGSGKYPAEFCRETHLGVEPQINSGSNNNGGAVGCSDGTDGGGGGDGSGGGVGGGGSNGNLQDDGRHRANSAGSAVSIDDLDGDGDEFLQFVGDEMDDI